MIKAKHFFILPFITKNGKNGLSWIQNNHTGIYNEKVLYEKLKEAWARYGELHTVSTLTTRVVTAECKFRRKPIYIYD